MKLAAALAFLAAPLCGQAEFTDTILQGELWMPFQSLPPGELVEKGPDETKLDAMLEEMQTVFSGMIYGWSFVYRPVDPDRKAPEFLEVVPLGRIVGTSGDLKTARALAVATRVDKVSGIVAVDFRYYMTPFEAQRRRSWGAGNLDQSPGTGKAKVVDRLESRLDALRQSLKDAVRNLIRPRILNRPQEITGEALLREVPRYYFDAGQYVCSARYVLRIAQVRDYPLY